MHMTPLRKRRLLKLVILLAVLSLLFALFWHSSVTINPNTEDQAMARLSAIQSQTQPAPFVTDGCSGGLSEYWPTVVTQLDALAPGYSDSYNMAAVPFEELCVEHDKAYHLGVGGYAGRLEADNQLRAAIINYGTTNAVEIQNRLGLQSEVEAIFLYEIIAEALYRSVRAGGAPCTGQPYQWGYGYTTNQC